ncbi:MAG: ankyrin repeat domain-containing protein [Betaproteobacteria bacterium]|nr:ankyrin repeat domain-containing protein [Betaproteobacteria bacterium]
MKRVARRISLAMGLMVWLLTLLGGCPALAAQPDPVRFGVAVEQGDLVSVKEWLEAGLAPDFIADRVGSGLMIAAWEGNIPMMALFFQHGARIDLSNRYDEQALQLAAWKGHLEAVKWLLAHGARVNRSGPHWNALHYAAFADRREIARLLLEQGADVNARAPNGSTALMMAAREGREELARQLLVAGADARASNENGDTALSWAMRYQNFRIAQMVSTAAEFAQAAQAPPESFGAAVRSQPAPPEIEEILRQIRLTQVKGGPVDDLRKKLFEAVARFKKGSRQVTINKASPGKPAARGKPKALVITARRAGKPGGERVELEYARTNSATPRMPTKVPEILDQMARARAAGKPVDDLRKALFEAVARFKKGGPD